MITGAPPQSNLQTGVGSMMPPHCLPLPQGVPRLPSNLNPLGVHVAMYNMLLLQNPHMRAKLPPLPTTLGGEPLSPHPLYIEDCKLPCTTGILWVFTTLSELLLHLSISQGSSSFRYKNALSAKITTQIYTTEHTN